MTRHGDSYRDIIRYWGPELISAAILFTLPLLADAYIVSQLHSTTLYGTLGFANNMFHLLTKLAEALSIATTTVVGAYNGAGDYRKAGRTLGDAFWTTILVGGIPAIIVYSFAGAIFRGMGVPEPMVAAGTPFIRLQAISILLTFLYLAIIGFLKGIKNTRTPMMIYLVGIVVFLIADYALVLGRCGMPQMRLAGSAWARILQFGVMLCLALWHVLSNTEYRKYFSHAFYRLFDRDGALSILNRFWQIAIDKTSLAFAYIILGWHIAPMGKYAIASFSVIKDLERLAFLPAIAFASVLTFLVSNRLGAHDAAGARANVKRVLMLTAGSVIAILFVLSLNPAFFVQIFDHKGTFTVLASRMFPIISIFVVFDFVQLILAAALRGAGDVSAVMVVRAVISFGVFLPLSTYAASLPIEDVALKFVLIYAIFYLCSGLMGLLFLLRIKTNKWEKLTQPS